MTHHHDHIGLQAAGQVRWVALLAIVVAGVMMVIKAAAWWITGSVALLGSFLDAVMDVSLSVMNFFAIRHSQTPADREHRFGHGKAEALAALVQGVMLLGAGLFLLYEAFWVMVNPQPVTQSGIGIAAILISIVLTFGLVTVQKRVAKATQSLAIVADSAHYQGDLYMNLAVIGALVLAGLLGMTYADPILGFVVAGLLINSARQVLGAAADQIMDRELDDADRAQIKEIILSHPQVQGLHDLRSRRAGLASFIQCHIELDGSMTLNKAHAISDAVEASVMAKFPNAEVLIHQDPEGHEELTLLEQS